MYTALQLILLLIQVEDWQSVTLSDLRELGFPHHIDRPRLAELLQERYPRQSFEKSFRLKGRYSKQKRLERILRFTMFPVSLLVFNSC